MGYTIQQIESNLVGMTHSGSLNKVRNKYEMFERAANNLLAVVDPITTMRVQPINNTIHDNVYNYPLPSDFKKIIDLYPSGERTNMDIAVREYAENFDLKKEIQDNRISIEADGGTRFIRINWRGSSYKTMNTLDSLTINGTWSGYATAANVAQDILYKVSGTGSVKFSVVASGDGIQNTTMTAVDLSSWDEKAEFFVWCYIPDTTNLTSMSLIFGNDLTTNYWTSAAQTAQADGTAFKAGWNLMRFPWSGATETGTVAPASIDALRLTFATTGAITDIRVDNITVSLGRIFDIKYFSNYLFKNGAGTYIARPSETSDVAQLGAQEINMYLYECLLAAAHQMEGKDSVFDMQFAQNELQKLYGRYVAEYPAQTKKAVTRWITPPTFRR